MGEKGGVWGLEEYLEVKNVTGLELTEFFKYLSLPIISSRSM